MRAMTSQITCVSIIYSTIGSGADNRKHQSSASLAFVWGIHRWPVNSPHKWPVTQKCFHLMTSSWTKSKAVPFIYFCSAGFSCTMLNLQLGLLGWTTISKTTDGLRARISNYFSDKICDPITHIWYSFNRGLVRPPLRLWHGCAMSRHQQPTGIRTWVW